MVSALGSAAAGNVESRSLAAGRIGLLIAGALLACLLFLVVTPLAQLAFSSLAKPDGGGLTLSNYAVAFGNVRHLQALRNSLLLGFGATVLCLIIAVPMAWAVSRTDMPCKSLVRFTVIATFITPSYLGGVAWILLGAPNAGWINKTWM